MDLRERVKLLANTLPCMENREKGNIDTLTGSTVTIRDYGFLKDEHDKDYVAFVVDENSKEFFFGGQVLTGQLQELDAENYKPTIQKDGLPVLLGKKMSKAKREYTTVTFYPEA